MSRAQYLQIADRMALYSFYALIYFVPISTALVEIFSTIIIVVFFGKRMLLAFEAVRESGKRGTPLFSGAAWSAAWTAARPSPSFLNSWVGFFMLVNLLSVVVSLDPMLSLKGFLFKLAQSVVLFYAFVEYVNDRRKLQIFLAAFFISSAIVSTDGLAQFFKGKGFIHAHRLQSGRVTASFKHPNDFGSYIVVVVLVVLGFLLTWRPWRKDHERPRSPEAVDLFSTPVQVGLAALFLMSTACLGLSFSRGAWLGFFLGLILLVMQKKKYFIIAVLTGVAFMFIFSPKLIKTRNVSFMSDDVRRQPGWAAEPADQEKRTFLDESWDRLQEATVPFGGMGRRGFWKEAIAIIKQFPFLGTGLNTYSKIAPEFKINWGGYPHNCFLQMAAETGLVGLFSFLAVLAVLFSRGLRALRGLKDRLYTATIMGGLAGLFGFLAHSFVDTNFYSVQLGTLMWLVIAMVAASVQMAQDKR